MINYNNIYKLSHVSLNNRLHVSLWKCRFDNLPYTTFRRNINVLETTFNGIYRSIKKFNDNQLEATWNKL